MSTSKETYRRSLNSFAPLLPAEQTLLDAAGKGEWADINTTRPKEETHENKVRAEFLRFLVLGGDEAAIVHERGITLQGAWISGLLDLECCNIPGRLGLLDCHFEKEILIRSAHIHGLLNLNGSQLPGLIGDRIVAEEGIFMRAGFIATKAVRLHSAQIDGNIECDSGVFDGKEEAALVFDRSRIQGSVFLRNGFKASGTVRMLGAQIGGNLDCAGGVFDGKEKAALFCDRSRIQGSVFLRSGFKASGTVRMLGAQIGGNLDCAGGVFDGQEKEALVIHGARIQGGVFLLNGFNAIGTIKIDGAQIDGDLICRHCQFSSTQNTSLFADRMEVRGCFKFQKLKTPANGVSLVASKVGQLDDDEASWGEDLVLDGFVYGHFSGDAPTNAEMRLKWLAKQRAEHFGQGFRPQPWKQLIRTLRNMGHDEDVRRVAIAYEKHRFKNGVVVGGLRRSFHKLFGLLIGYGYRPLRLFNIMLGVWLFCATMFWIAAIHGVFAPSNPLIFHHPDYQICRPDDTIKGQAGDKRNWYLCQQLAGEYTGFSPLAYSLDLILPLVDLQQEHDWAPYIPAPKSNWLDELSSLSKYHLTRLLVWFEILFGWLASLLLVAVISGLANRNDED